LGDLKFDYCESKMMKIAVLTIHNNEQNKQVLANFHQLSGDDLEMVFLFGFPKISTLQLCLFQNGFKYWMESGLGLQKSQILIAGRNQLVSSGQESSHPEPGVKFYYPKSDTTIVGIHFPQSPNIQIQDSFFRSLMKTLKKHTAQRTLLVGDFKIPPQNLTSILEFKHYFQKIAALGWLDAWRTLHPMTYEQIWYSNVQKEIHRYFVFLSPAWREFLLNAYHAHFFSDTMHDPVGSKVFVVELAS